MNQYGLTDEDMKKYEEIAERHGITVERMVQLAWEAHQEFFKDGEEAAGRKILNGELA